VSRDEDGEIGALKALALAGIEFVVVGVGGINFYARDAGSAVATQDTDILLRPTSSNLGAALRTLHRSGFELATRGEPFVDFDDQGILGNVIRAGAVIQATDGRGQLDLMLSGAGLRYDDVSSDATTFRIDDVEIRVGRLEKLLRSKELAGRAKDVEFLRMFAARMRDEVGE
jgi:hypothetical protein